MPTPPMASRIPNPSVVVTVSRMSIDHSSGQYMLNDDALSVEQLNSVIMLGAIRQRRMFAPRDGGTLGTSGLECSSLDFVQGRPTTTFPALEGNFPLAHVVDVISDPKLALDCGACVFKDWKEDRGKKIHPRCVTQIVVPMLIPTYDFETYHVAACSYARSAERAITDYMKDFSKANRPAYTRITRMRLNVNLGSGFKYSTPTFITVDDVPEEAYRAMSALYRTARDILQSPPPPRPPRSGGMLSVSSDEVAAPTYSGTFFS